LLEIPEPDLLQLTSSLYDSESFDSLTVQGASILTGRGQIGGRFVCSATTDSRQARGALSIADCRALADLFHLARDQTEPVILLLNSAGARIDQGLPALGAFRSAYREALECVTQGLPLFACIGRDCFGGASMLAMLAGKRAYARRARLALSGPRIVEAMAGRLNFDSRDPATVDHLMGAQARCRWHSTDVIVELEANPMRRVITSWLTAPGGAATVSLAHAHEVLSERLRGAEILAESAMQSLVTTDLRSFPMAQISSRLRGLSQAEADDPACISLISREPVGVIECWTMADVLLDIKDRQPGRPVLIALDIAGHSAMLQDEQLLLSDFVAHLALVVTSLCHAGHDIGLILLGRASGALYAALAASATRVIATADAKVQVLPVQAAMHITGEPGAIDEADLLASGIADQIIH
jgi:hypothetical protein